MTSGTIARVIKTPKVQQRQPLDFSLGRNGRKTAIRRLVKYLPLSAELQTAVALDELADIGAGQGLEMSLGDDSTWS